MVLTNITNSGLRVNRQQRYTPSRGSIEDPSFLQDDEEKNTLITENMELKKKLAELENNEARSERVNRRHKLPQLSDEDGKNEVKNLGQQFAFTGILWMHDPGNTFRSAFDDDWDPADRFVKDDVGIIQGQYRELMDFIPSNLHGKMEDGLFINTFMAGMQTQRSNGSTRVKQQARHAIFQSTNQDFTTRADHFKELIGWTINEDGKGCYKVLAPILFKDYAGKFDKWKIFRHPIIMRMYAALFRGPSSLKDVEDGAICGPAQAHHNLELQWKLRNVSAGAIAASAIYARFAASTDSAFKTVGGDTKIQYQQDYEFYLQYLYDGLQNKSPSVLRIFEEWNAVFYGNLPGVVSNGISKGTLDEGLDDIIDGIRGEAVQERLRIELEQDQEQEQEQEAVTDDYQERPFMAALEGDKSPSPLTETSSQSPSTRRRFSRSLASITPVATKPRARRNIIDSDSEEVQVELRPAVHSNKRKNKDTSTNGDTSNVVRRSKRSRK